MKGYPQYPNVDIQKYLTKLLANNLIIGGVYNYSITPKGIEYAQKLTGSAINDTKSYAEVRRDIKAEIERITNSKVFGYYLKTERPTFVESDFFEFMGTSSRSLHTHNDSSFLRKYNMIVNDVIPFCDKNKKVDKNAKTVVDLWKILFKQFGELTRNTK